MTLEADSPGASSGWQVYGNTFDASQNTGFNGSTPTGSSKAYPMYVRDTSLSGGLTMRGNTIVYNATTPIIRFGATSASDTSHDLSQSTFDQTYPNYEITGPVVSALHLTSTGSAPTAVSGTGAGSGTPAVNVTGTDTRGTFNFTTGTSPTTFATVATFTFATAFTGSGQVTCMIQPSGYTNNAQVVAVASTSDSGFVISTQGTGLTGATFYSYWYECGQ